jgi:8-oxo-dGTP pyrophosphatase MutT (NUDIX family)
MNAGVILRAPNGRVLFLRRSLDSADEPDKWCWPGGTGEDGETAQETAIRETEEETGHRITGRLTPIDSRNGFVTFLSDVGSEFEPQLNEEHHDAHWTEPDDLRLIRGNIHPGVVATLAERKLPKGEAMAGDVSLALDRSVRTTDAFGRLHVSSSPITKACVNPYMGQEIPNWEALGLNPARVYKLLRDPRELARPETVASANNLPVLSVHKPTSADDPQKEFTVGSTGTNAVWAAPYITNSLVAWDAEAIAGIETDEQREISAGYRYTADMTPGDYEGEYYDGVMRNITFNHVALVDKGRAGPDVIVGDRQLRTEPMIKTAALRSRKVLLVQGALAGYLAPKLAMDAAIDLGPVLKGVTGKNYTKSKATIVERLSTACKGKLAMDGDLEDVLTLLDRMDGVGGQPADPGFEADDAIPEGAPPAVDPADGVPPPAPAPEDAPVDIEAVLALLAGKLDPETLAKVQAALQPGGEEEEDPTKPAAPPPVEANDDETTPVSSEKKEDTMTVGAMDRALRTHGAQVRRDTIAEMGAIADAREKVRPLIGDVTGRVGSASEVYKLALDHACETGLTTIDLATTPASAYPALVDMAVSLNAARTRVGARRDAMAMDAANGADDFAKRYPGAANIKTIG